MGGFNIAGGLGRLFQLGAFFGGGSSSPAASSMTLGMNLGTLESSATYRPFANMVWMMGLWQQYSGSGTYSQSNGVLSASVSTNVFRAYLSDQGLGCPSGTYTVYNPDGCKISIGTFSNPTAYQTWTTATSFTFNWSSNVNGMFLFVTGSLTNNNGPLAIIIPNHATSWNAGNWWNADYLTYQTALGSKVLRFMDWHFTNGNTETNWSDRTTVPEAGGSISFCSWFGVNNNNAGQVVVPWEVQIDLANRLGADPWINIPVRATNSYLSSLAALLASNLNSSRKVWVEYGNEIWNFASAFSATTNWAYYLNYTRYTATANYSAQTFTCANHGLTQWESVLCWGVGQDGPGFSSADYRLTVSGNLFANVIDVNTFTLYSAASGGTQIAFPSDFTTMIFVKTDQSGLSPDLAAPYVNQCINIWNYMDSALGASRVKHLIGGQAATPNLLTSRMVISNVASRADYCHIAPYFTGTMLAGNLSISSGQIVPQYWTTSSAGTVYFGVYANGATPTVSDVIAGNNAIAFENVTYSSEPSSFVSMPAMTGLSNGTTYSCFFVFEYTSSVTLTTYYWMLSASAAVSATSSSVAVNDTFANQALRCEISILASLIGIEQNQTGANGVPVICYEGGPGYGGLTLPSAVNTWVFGTNGVGAFIDSNELATAYEKYLREYSNIGLKHFNQYADILIGFDISYDLYTLYPLYSAFGSFDGSVAQTTGVSVSNLSPSNILSAPGSYPYAVASLGSSAYTYSIITGNNAGNYAISGNTIELINSTGINYAVPEPVVLTILATDGNTDATFTVSFATGNAWYPADAQFVFSTISDTTTSAVNPAIGGALTLYGTAASLNGNFWQNASTTLYTGGSALTEHLLNTQPFLVACVLGAQTLVGNYNSIILVGGPGAYVGFIRAGGTVIDASLYYSSTSESITFPGGFSSTEKVYWIYYDGDGNWHFGTDQTEQTGMAYSGAVPSGNFGTGVSMMGLQWGTSGGTPVGSVGDVINFGSVEVLSRAGLTLTQALAYVQQMQTYHGI